MWGSPAGVRYSYRHPIASERIPHHDLLLARRGKELVGAYVIIERPWGYFRHLLAVSPETIGAGVGHALMEHAYNEYSPRLRPGQVILGTVETTNKQSSRLSLRYYDEVGHLEVLTFSRRKPRLSANCFQSSYAVFQARLPTTGRVWDHLDEFFLEKFSFEYRDVHGEPVAGVVIEPHQWKLHSLPGIQHALLPVLPPLLGVSRNAYDFGMMHYWWGNPGHYGELWEHGLAALGLTSGLATGDVLEPQWEAVKRVGRGVVGSLSGLNHMLLTGTAAPPGPITFTPMHAL